MATTALASVVNVTHCSWCICSNHLGLDAFSLPLRPTVQTTAFERSNGWHGPLRFRTVYLPVAVYCVLLVIDPVPLEGTCQ